MYCMEIVPQGFVWLLGSFLFFIFLDHCCIVSSADLRLISILLSMSLIKISNRNRSRTDSCRYYLITALHPNDEQFVTFSMVQFYKQFGIHPIAEKTWLEKVKTLLKSAYVGLWSSYHQACLLRIEKWNTVREMFSSQQICIVFNLSSFRLLSFHGWITFSPIFLEIELQVSGPQFHGLPSFLFWK